MRDFEIYPEQTGKSENQREVRIQYARKDPLPDAHLEVLHDGVFQVQGDCPVIQPADFPAVVTLKYALNIRDNGIDEVAFESFLCRVRPAFGDTQFCQLRIAAALRCIAANIRRGIAD